MIKSISEEAYKESEAVVPLPSTWNISVPHSFLAHNPKKPRGNWERIEIVRILNLVKSNNTVWFLIPFSVSGNSQHNFMKLDYLVLLNSNKNQNRKDLILKNGVWKGKISQFLNLNLRLYKANLMQKWKRVCHMIKTLYTASKAWHYGL